MNRQALERHQVFVYLVAILTGLMLGTALPAAGAVLEPLLWPVLGLLLYATFTLVPLNHLREAFRDGRFLAAATLGNFVLIPLLAWALMLLAPDDPAVRLGILLVLLVPCTDWFITFTQLGGGDTRRAIAFSPVSLLLQILLLPIYLWFLFPGDLTLALARDEMLLAFFGLIIVPLLLALGTEHWAARSDTRRRLVNRLGNLPVPLLAVVVFIVATSQVHLVVGALPLLLHLLLIFTLFLLAAGWLAWAMSRLFRLPPEQGRVLAFSFGTRNSFVVLPLALALPASLEVAVVVIVFQSLVELLGMAVFLWWVPKRLFRDEGHNMGNPA